MSMTTRACLCGAATEVRRAEREREALAARVRTLEAALAAIERETDLALSEPGVAFFITRRVAAITTRTLERHHKMSTDMSTAFAPGSDRRRLCQSAPRRRCL